MKIYIYFHICCINNWADIVAQSYTHIKSSGLYDIIEEIRCGVLGEHDGSHPLFADPKVSIVAQSLEIKTYEILTLDKLLADASSTDHEEFYVLYIHSKGVGYNANVPNVTDWVNYLTYFNIYRHKDCMWLLQNHGYDAVGVNITEKPILHYSGNFWWSTSKHIATLPPIDFIHYHAAEFWVCSGKGKYVTLWQSDINHYNKPYPISEYVNKEITTKGIEKNYTNIYKD